MTMVNADEQCLSDWWFIGICFGGKYGEKVSYRVVLMKTSESAVPMHLGVSR
jgi:hypothetical protein